MVSFGVLYLYIAHVSIYNIKPKTWAVWENTLNIQTIVYYVLKICAPATSMYPIQIDIGGFVMYLKPNEINIGLNGSRMTSSNHFIPRNI